MRNEYISKKKKTIDERRKKRKARTQKRAQQQKDQSNSIYLRLQRSQFSPIFVCFTLSTHSAAKAAPAYWENVNMIIYYSTLLCRAECRQQRLQTSRHKKENMHSRAVRSSSIPLFLPTVLIISHPFTSPARSCYSAGQATCWRWCSAGWLSSRPSAACRETRSRSSCPLLASRSPGDGSRRSRNRVACWSAGQKWCVRRRGDQSGRREYGCRHSWHPVPGSSRWAACGSARRSTGSVPFGCDCDGLRSGLVRSGSSSPGNYCRRWSQAAYWRSSGLTVKRCSSAQTARSVAGRHSAAAGAARWRTAG